MLPDDVENGQHDDAEERQHGEDMVRCFRCGQLYPRDYVRVLHGDCPEVFKNRDLCISCVEVVKGKRGPGWWCASAALRAGA